MAATNKFDESIYPGVIADLALVSVGCQQVVTNITIFLAVDTIATVDLKYSFAGVTQIHQSGIVKFVEPIRSWRFPCNVRPGMCSCRGTHHVAPPNGPIFHDHVCRYDANQFDNRTSLAERCTGSATILSVPRISLFPIN